MANTQTGTSSDPIRNQRQRLRNPGSKNVRVNVAYMWGPPIRIATMLFTTTLAW
jgi:hypothetical protein